MQTIAGHLYDYPKYYDLVYGSDWRAEVNFLEDCFEKHVERPLQQPVRRLFEPACGTGRLLFRLAEAGYDVAGNDLNEKAVAFCNARLARRGLAGSAVVGDMADFRLARQVDAAFCTINSFRHLLDEQAAVAHLQCMAAALRSGGIYVLGLHLSPTDAEPQDEESWTARRGNLAVLSRLSVTDRDPRRRLETRDMTFDVYTPRRQFRLADTVQFRMYSAGQMATLIAEIEALEIIETYDFGYDVDTPIQIDGQSEDVVYILRKR